MLKQLSIIFLLIVILPASGIGQDLDPGPGYQMVLINNPALSGSEGDGILRLSYHNFYPGNNYNFHSVNLSYDSYFPALHGGAGFYLSDDYLGGIINDMKGGFSYSYFLQAGRELFVNAGLSASFLHRGFNFSEAILPDQIDPLGGVSGTSSENLSNSGLTVFDIGAGFIFISGKVSGGLSVSHLAEPDLSKESTAGGKLKRKYLIHLAGDLDINEARHLKIRPITFMSLQGKFISAGVGTVFESDYLSLNCIFMGNSNRNANIQTGFSIKTGRISFYYNYCFNIASGNSLLPISLLHQTGLALSLNNVNKRNSIKTINFPEL